MLSERHTVKKKEGEQKNIKKICGTACSLLMLNDSKLLVQPDKPWIHSVPGHNKFTTNVLKNWKEIYEKAVNVTNCRWLIIQRDVKSLMAKQRFWRRNASCGTRNIWTVDCYRLIKTLLLDKNGPLVNTLPLYTPALFTLINLRADEEGQKKKSEKKNNKTFCQQQRVWWSVLM